MVVKTKRLPKGFVFPISKRVLKETLRPFAAFVTLAEFDGISHSEKPAKQRLASQQTWFWVGNVSVIWVEGAFVFRLRIDAVRRERVGETAELLGRVIATDIADFMNATLGLLETDPAWGKHRSLHVGFEIGPDATVVSRSFIPNAA